MIINCKITNTFMECDMMRIVRLTRKYLYCKFEFLTPEDWEGTEKYARFENVKSGVKRSAVIDDEGMCLVPWECLTTEGYLNFSAHGERADGYTINTRVRRTLLEDTLDGGEDSRPPTPNLYIQMLEQRAKANEIVQTVAQELSEEEQIQARTNIGAASTNEVSKLSEEIADLKENGTGLSTEAKDLLITILKNAVYSTNQSDNIILLENALATGSDDSGGNGDSEGGTENVEELITQSGSIVTIGKYATLNAIQTDNTITIS